MSIRPETRHRPNAVLLSRIPPRGPGIVFTIILLVISPMFPTELLRAQDLRGNIFRAPLADATVFRNDHFPRAGAYQDRDTTRRERKDPLLAMGLSAVLPGAGQAYTENYWKIPVIWGLGGYWIYEWIRNNDRYREFGDRYSESVAESPPYGDDRYLKLREFYRDQRDSFTWYLSLLYALNILDAYVGAHLYDFDVGPDLGDRGSGIQVSVRMTF